MSRFTLTCTLVALLLAPGCAANRPAAVPKIKPPSEGTSSYVSTNVVAPESVPPPPKTLLKRIQSAGMTITPDFGRNDVYGAAFDSEATWVYRVGDRADSLVISEHPSSAEASSQVSTPAFSGTLGPDPAASTNFYAFVSGHYLIAYFHHKNGPVGAVEAFSRVFGKPSRIAHWNVGP